MKSVHLFADGREVFTSELSPRARAAALEAMIATRVASAHDAAPQPLFVPDPVYPETVKPRVKGEAVVTCRVDAQGRVVNPTTASATSPAFGTAALEAVRDWRFVPAVKAGIPIEASVRLPVEFDPAS